MLNYNSLAGRVQDSVGGKVTKTSPEARMAKARARIGENRIE
jgi:hypothetical protein